MRSVRNLLQHELIGLECEVVRSTNRSQEGVSGRITDETLKTLVVGGKRIFKKGSIFKVTVGSDIVFVDGNYINTRPEDRIKKRIRKW